MRRNEIFFSAVIVMSFYVGINSLAAQSNLLDWTFSKGDSYHASPVHKDNTIFIGGMDGYFYAIDARTGNEVWKFYSGQPILSTAAVHNNQVMFVSGGKIFALNLHNGTELWSYCTGEQSTQAQIDAWDYHHSSPYIHKNVVYFGDDWGNLNGVDIDSGKLVFQYTTDTKMAIRSTPVIQDGIVFFGDYVGIIYAVSISDSSLLWSHTPYDNLPYEGFGNVCSKFVVYRDGLYFGARNPDFYCLDIKDGAIKWNINDKEGSWMSGTPIIKNDILYFGASDNHLFYAIEPISGEIVWTHKTSQNIFTTPLFFENLICFGTVDSYNHESGKGILRIIDKQNGELVNKFAPECNIISSPIKVNESIVFGTSKGEVRALNINLFLTHR